MQVRVLGCSGSMAQGHHTTSFLVDDDLLIDAGSGVGTLTTNALHRIDHVLLTHSHLDHVLALPLLADIVIRHRQERELGPITVHALPATVQTLQEHLFNNRLWPDFTRIPSAAAPVLRLQTLDVWAKRCAWEAARYRFCRHTMWCRRWDTRCGAPTTRRHGLGHSAATRALIRPSGRCSTPCPTWHIGSPKWRSPTETARWRKSAATSAPRCWALSSLRCPTRCRCT